MIPTHNYWPFDFNGRHSILILASIPINNYCMAYSEFIH